MNATFSYSGFLMIVVHALNWLGCIESLIFRNWRQFSFYDVAEMRLAPFANIYAGAAINI